MANNTDHDTQMEQKNDSIRVGLDYTIKSSISAVDKSSLSFDEKRNLIFSLYSFRCLFDNSEMMYINPSLVKYKCTFSSPLFSHPLYAEHKDEFEQIQKSKTMYIPYGGLYVYDGDDYVLRYDAGSPVWQMLFDMGRLDEVEKTIPQKYELYDMVYEVVNMDSCDDDLRAMWYLIFPYVMLVGAPHDIDMYQLLFQTLAVDNLFERVLPTTYSLYVKDSVGELVHSEVPNNIITWYEPYIAYKSEMTERGVTREVERYQSWLKKGMFTLVFIGTEKLLNTFPDDDDLLLCNLASRVSLKNVKSDAERKKILQETLAITDTALERSTSKKALITYYSALAHLGLNDADTALNKFEDCLTFDPTFQPASVMIKAIKEQLKK